MKNVTAAVIVVLLAVIAALLFRRPAPPPVVSPPAVTVTPSPPEPNGPRREKPGSGVIYTTSSGPDADENGLAAHTVALHGASPARDALNALCESPHSPLPKGTILRGVKIADGLATADFSRAFETNFHGGSTEEAQTVNSILLTLGQFPTIERVQILVDGKRIDALSNLPIDGPLDVIRPGATQTAARGGGA